MSLYRFSMNIPDEIFSYMEATTTTEAEEARTGTLPKRPRRRSTLQSIKNLSKSTWNLRVNRQDGSGSLRLPRLTSHASIESAPLPRNSNNNSSLLSITSISDESSTAGSSSRTSTRRQEPPRPGSMPDLRVDHDGILAELSRKKSKLSETRLKRAESNAKLDALMVKDMSALSTNRSTALESVRSATESLQAPFSPPSKFVPCAKRPPAGDKENSRKHSDPNSTAGTLVHG